MTADTGTSTPQHEAEEQVFCSDGLEPIEIKSYQNKSYSYGVGTCMVRGGAVGDGDNNNNDNDDDAVFCEEQEEDSSLIPSPMTAFEVFQGKVMPSRSLYRKGPLNKSQQAETSLEKLARLQRELQELQQDIATVDSNMNPQAEDAEGENSNSTSTSSELSRMAQELASKLAAVETSQNQPRASSASLQSHLTALVHEELNKLKRSEPKGETGIDSETENAGDVKDGKITYELYSNPGGATTDANLEARLGALEKVLGNTTNSNSPSSLDDRLLDMEHLLQHLGGAGDGKVNTTGTASTLAETAQRAKVIRADLEAAAKARAKLSSVSSGGASAADAKKISELHDQLLSIKDLTANLPEVVERCHALAQLHTCAADSMTRLNAVEQATRSTTQLLQSIDLTLSKLEQSTAENLDTMQQNVQALVDK